MKLILASSSTSRRAESSTTRVFRLRCCLRLSTYPRSGLNPSGTVRAWRMPRRVWYLRRGVARDRCLPRGTEVVLDGQCARLRRRAAHDEDSLMNAQVSFRGCTHSVITGFTLVVCRTQSRRRFVRRRRYILRLRRNKSTRF